MAYKIDELAYRYTEFKGCRDDLGKTVYNGTHCDGALLGKGKCGEYGDDVDNFVF